MEPVLFFGLFSPYRYWPQPIPATWQAVPVNYMFGRWAATYWQIFYIGEAKDAADRFSSHERWSEAVMTYGATHILNHVASADVSVRRMEERDLIHTLRPPMNTQHQPKAILSGIPSAMPARSHLGLINLHGI